MRLVVAANEMTIVGVIPPMVSYYKLVILSKKGEGDSYSCHAFCVHISFEFKSIVLTEVAGEGGTNWAPQKFLSSKKLRHLMG